MVTYGGGGENGAVFVLSWEILQYYILMDSTWKVKVHARGRTRPREMSWRKGWDTGNGRSGLGLPQERRFFHSTGGKARGPLCAQKGAIWSLTAEKFLIASSFQ